MTRLRTLLFTAYFLVPLAGCSTPSAEPARTDTGAAPTDGAVRPNDAARVPDDTGADAGSTALDAAPRADAWIGTALCGTDPAAFPGAEGFGACARGGRGGRVIHVTTLAAGGTGSLQAALDETGPRTIVFDVSGVIDGIPELTNGQVTIAGQTSPGGVTLRGLRIEGDEVCEAEDCPLPTVQPDDVVVRFLRLRPAGEGDDGLRLHHATRVIVDHVSIGNAGDEALQISFSRDLTVQWSVLGETLTTGHEVVYGGILVNYSDPARGFPNTRMTLHHDLLVRIAGRMPELNRENHHGDEGQIADVELVSNVAWDPRRPITATTETNYGGEVGWRLDLVDLFFFVRPDHPHALFVLEPAPTLSGTSALLDGDALSRFPDLADWQVANRCDCNDYGTNAATGVLPYDAPPSWARHTPLTPPVAVTRTGRGLALADELAARAGVLPHDAMDRRFTAYVTDRRFDDAPLDTNPLGDALVLDAAPALPADADGDGMADAWESASGLDPAHDDSADVGTLSSSRLGVEGYTNLEVYLAELALARIAP